MSTARRKLVGLNAYQPDHPPSAGAGNHPDQPVGSNPPIRLVDCCNADFDVFAEYLAVSAVGHQAMHGGQSVGGDEGTAPLEGIALLVIVRGLDEDEMKYPVGHRNAALCFDPSPQKIQPLSKTFGRSWPAWRSGGFRGR
jgi:hypothetical protein